MSDAAYYAKLAAAVDEILDEIKNDPIGKDWAVNWGDLHCVQINKILQLYPANIHGDEQIVVLIEEAEPCSELQNYIENALFERGYDVTVETEW